MSVSKMTREVRAFANGVRVSTGVHLKEGSFLQTYPTKQQWGSEMSWRQVILLQQKGKSVEFFYGDRKTAMKHAQTSAALRKELENWALLFERRDAILSQLPAEQYIKLRDFLQSGDIKKLA